MTNNNQPVKPATKKQEQEYRYAKPGTVLYVPSILDRIRVLFGRNVAFSIVLQFEHNPGRMHVSHRFGLTKHKVLSPVADEQKPETN